MSMSKLLENGLEAQVLNGLVRDNGKVKIFHKSVTVLFTSPTKIWLQSYSRHLQNVKMELQSDSQNIRTFKTSKF